MSTTSGNQSDTGSKDPLVPSKMTVDELRDELRERGHPTTGLKPVLAARLQEILKQPGTVQYKLAGSAARKRKRLSNKREPRRGEFETEEEFDAAWTKWRESRDNNNESVKRSRQQAKKRREEQERLHREREAENAQLEQLVSQMKEEVSFLNKVLKTPELLDRQELGQLEQLLAQGVAATGPQP